MTGTLQRNVILVELSRVNHSVHVDYVLGSTMFIGALAEWPE